MAELITVERILGALLGVGITFALAWFVTWLERRIDRKGMTERQAVLAITLTEKSKRKNDEVVLLGDDGEVYALDEAERIARAWAAESDDESEGARDE